MKINCGIIGLPNVGKSTLFQLLTNISVKIDNFPFSTIQPNIAIVQVCDNRLYQISHIIKSKAIMADVIEFVDIAGLIKGAAQGEGLGNKILNHIKTVKILCHVVRCFDNDLIVHVENYTDPQRDINIVNTELILFDILQCESNIALLQKSRVINNYIDQELYILKKCLHGLYDGLTLRNMQFSKTEIVNIQKFNFLTFKPVIYFANVDKDNRDNIYLKKLKKIGFHENISVISHCCAINNDKSTSQLKQSNTILYMIANNIISLLQLNTFFTVNINMIKSWLCPVGTIALNAAYSVHSDFKKGFIRVQVIRFDDFIANQGEIGSKKSGKIYFAGKNYLIQDGDILKFLFQKQQKS